MVNTYELKLETGEVYKVAFPNYAAKKYAREFYTGKDPKSIEDIMMDIGGIFSTFQDLEKLGNVNSALMYKMLDDICVKLIPFFYCGANAYKVINKQIEDVTLEESKRAISLLPFDQIMLLMKGMQDSVMPVGLPKETAEDKKKESKEQGGAKGLKPVTKKLKRTATAN